jgi:uncharacterized protein YuzE
MKITYSKDSDALAIDFRDGEYHESQEIFDGFVIDFDNSGRPMGIEIYDDASNFVDIGRLKLMPEEAPIEPRKQLETVNKR